MPGRNSIDHGHRRLGGAGDRRGLHAAGDPRHLAGPFRKNGGRWQIAWPFRKVPYLVLLVSLLVFGFFPRLLTEKIIPSATKVQALATVPSATPVVAAKSALVAEVKP